MIKYTCSVKIFRPIDEVLELWKNKANNKQWQENFDSYVLIEGEEGEVGAKTRLIYDISGQTMELLETITEMNLPEVMSATYDHKLMSNTMTNRFVAIDEQTTEWISDVEYTDFKAKIYASIAALTPGKFKEQTQKWLDQFKIFAETKR